MKTIGRNNKGPAVVDIQQRLRTLGYELNVDGVFLDRTQIAVSDFRKREGLPAGDFIDEAAWSALVDATFALGDRTLYLRMPFFHGKDVSQLQRILNTLGFVVGDADGIFGAHTESALRDRRRRGRRYHLRRHQPLASRVGRQGCREPSQRGRAHGLLACGRGA